MISPDSQARFQEALGKERHWEREYGELLVIRNRNGEEYGRGGAVELGKYYKRLTFEANRFTATPFSSFVIFNGEGEVLGRLGIGQGYDRAEADHAAIAAAVTEEALQDKPLYEAAENETQIGVLLAPEAYERLYQATKELGTKVATFLMEQGFPKPLNDGEEGYFKRARAPVDRWTFTIVDTKLVKPGQVSEAERRQLAFKQAQIEELEGRGVVRNYGYLMPKSIDSRNDSELPRIVFGQP